MTTQTDSKAVKILLDNSNDLLLWDNLYRVGQSGKWSNGLQICRIGLPLGL